MPNIAPRAQSSPDNAPSRDNNACYARIIITREHIILPGSYSPVNIWCPALCFPVAISISFCKA